MASKPWKALKLLKGSAAQAPKPIRALLDESDVHGIDELVVGKQKWCTASPRIVNELLDGLAASASPALVLMVIADIVGGNATDSWLASTPPSNKTRQLIVDLLIERAPELGVLTEHEDSTVVAAVCAALTQLPTLPKAHSVLLELAQGCVLAARVRQRDGSERLHQRAGVFDIAFESGSEPISSSYRVPAMLVGQVAEVGAGLTVTIYLRPTALGASDGSSN